MAAARAQSATAAPGTDNSANQGSQCRAASRLQRGLPPRARTCHEASLQAPRLLTARAESRCTRDDAALRLAAPPGCAAAASAAPHRRWTPPKPPAAPREPQLPQQRCDPALASAAYMPLPAQPPQLRLAVSATAASTAKAALRCAAKAGAAAAALRPGAAADRLPKGPSAWPLRVRYWRAASAVGCCRNSASTTGCSGAGGEGGNGVGRTAPRSASEVKNRDSLCSWFRTGTNVSSPTMSHTKTV